MGIQTYPLAPRDPDWVTVLHISDLHFRSESSCDESRVTWLKNFHAYLSSQALPPVDVITVTGDLVDYRELRRKTHLATLRAAKEYLKRLCALCKVDPATHLFVIPGNHDCRWSGFLGWAGWGRGHFDDALKDYARDRIFDVSTAGFRPWKLLVACYDSNVVRGRGQLARGAVDRTEMNVIANEHASASGKTAPVFKLALVHHHPLPVVAAEDLDPSGRLEKALAMKLEGAPGFMIFQNAGNFIDALLRQDFRAALHGHLHHRGYLRVGRAQGGQDRALEVFSAASLGAPPSNGRHSFHLLRIGRNGTLDSQHYDFDSEGRQHGPERIDCLSYEFARARHWDSCPGEPPPIAACDLHQKSWVVSSPRGDVVATDRFEGLHCLKGECDEIPLFSTATSLMAHQFTAWVPGDPSRVKAIVVPLESGADGTRARREYRLRFAPALGPDPVDVVVQFKLEGAVMASREEQRFAGLPADEQGWESCSQVIRYRTGRLQMSLRFLPPSAMPERMSLDVLEPIAFPQSNGGATPRSTVSERASRAVTFAQWTNGFLPSDSEKPITPFPDPEATCVVDRPLLRHRYRFRWDIPESSPIDHRARALHIRRQMLAVQHAGGDKEQIAIDFLTHCVNAARETAKKADRASGHDDKQLHACLFALDEQSRVLKCVATTAPGSQLSAVEIPWGRDIIGQAFRRGSLVTLYRRDPSQGLERVESLPRELHCVLAYPIYCYNVDGYPTGVVAIASTNATTGLYALPGYDAENGRFFEETLWDRINDLWLDPKKEEPTFSKLLGIPPKLA